MALCRRSPTFVPSADEPERHSSMTFYLTKLNAVLVGAGLTLQCGANPPRALSDSAAGLARRSAAIVYDLRSIEDQPLPAHRDGGRADCSETVFSGTFELGDSTWVSTDSSVRKCPPGLTRREQLPSRFAGVHRHVNDSLFFFSRDSSGGEFPVDRGMTRHDTLFTGGGGGWPDWRIYVRRRR